MSKITSKELERIEVKQVLFFCTYNWDCEGHNVRNSQR